MTVSKANLNLEQIIAEKTRLRSRVTPLADAETPAVTAEEGEMYSITFTQEATVYEGAYAGRTTAFTVSSTVPKTILPLSSNCATGVRTA